MRSDPRPKRTPLPSALPPVVAITLTLKQHVAAGTTVYGLNDLYRLRLQELTFTRHPSGRSPATMNLPGAAEAHKN